MKHLDYLDGWRGLAIFLVLQAHFFEISAFDSGRLGVDIFFVLSGFLMSHILFKRNMPLTVFYKRRISRILPLFFLFIAVVYGAGFFLNNPESHSFNVFSTALFLRTYVPAMPSLWETDLPIGHLWSLNVEEHCYIFLSLISLFSLRSAYKGGLLILFGGCAIFIHIIYAWHPEFAPHKYLLRTEVVASHLLISSGYYLIKHKLSQYIYAWMPVVSFFLACLCYIDIVRPFSWLLSPFLLAFTVNHLSETSLYIQKFLSFSVLRFLGIYSYSIYIWQQVFYYYGIKHGLLFPYANFVFISISILVGIVSFRLFENPIRVWLNKNW